MAMRGNMIGAHIAKNHKSETWERVYDREHTASLLVGPTKHGGVAIGFSIPFGSGDSADGSR